MKTGLLVATIVLLVLSIVVGVSSVIKYIKRTDYYLTPLLLCTSICSVTMLIYSLGLQLDLWN